MLFRGSALHAEAVGSHLDNTGVRRARTSPCVVSVFEALSVIRSDILQCQLCLLSDLSQGQGRSTSNHDHEA